ncbi:MAG: lactate utilization protein [Ruminococcus sp.]
MNCDKKLDMTVIEKTMENLEKNNMKPYFCGTSQEALALVKSLMCQGETVACGGSATLKETGVADLLRSGEYNLLDRDKEGLTREEIEAIFVKSFAADTYLMSTNALTEQGELYNVDGNSNRVAALLYGPKSVIVLCGYNKIVKNLDEAVKRVKEISAPLNTKRLHTGAYCEALGKCKSLQKDDAFMCDGCRGTGRICCNYVVSAQQRKKDRIKVIIVGEELGF